jgi:Hypothetical glycosyl hydrolase 6
MRFSNFPLRQVHLDFHTSPDIPDVGADWDAAHWTKTLTQARVNSIVLFAKCHHGMNYYPSQIGPVHPGMAIDLLGEQISACQAAGIRVLVYISAAWDMSAAERHPEWRQIDVNGRQVGRAPLESGWGWPWLCLNTAYADELIAQTNELIDRYPIDGFFYDAVLYDHDGCLCPTCFRELREQGLDPANRAHRRDHNHASARRFMDRIATAIHAKQPAADVCFNTRWGLHFEDESQYYTQVDLEALPTGGWGYGFYPLWSRWARNFGKPMSAMTGRFHGSWADWGGLKHPDAMRFECGTILAAGGAVSMGDQLHPRGRLNDAIYDMVGEAFRDIEAVEAYCHAAVAAPQIGLLVLNTDVNDQPILASIGAEIEGASKILLELHHQFDVITVGCPDFAKYQLIIAPDRGPASPELAARLKAFVAQGSKLLTSHEALLDQATGRFALTDELGFDYLGRAESVLDYFTLTDPALHTVVSRSGFPYSLYDGPTVRVAPRPGTARLAEAYATYFNRSWQHFTSHRATPPLAEAAGYPAITQRDGVIYIYGPIFSAYQQYGNLTFRALVGRCLDLLLPQQLVETDAPASAEVSLMRQGRRDVVHVVNYSPGRRAPGHIEVLETPVPLRDVTLRLRRTAETTRVHMPRTGAELPFDAGAGIVTVVVPRIDAYDVIVFEGAL